MKPASRAAHRRLAARTLRRFIKVRAARRVHAAGGATGTVMRDRRRAGTRRAREMAATMRARARLGRDEGAAIGRMTGNLADLAESAAAQAAAVLRNGAARSGVPSAGGCAGRWASRRSSSNGPPRSWPRPGDGVRIAVLYTKVHNRLLVPLTAANQRQAPPVLRAALTTIWRHVDDYANRARLPRAA